MLFSSRKYASNSLLAVRRSFSPYSSVQAGQATLCSGVVARQNENAGTYKERCFI